MVRRMGEESDLVSLLKDLLNVNKYQATHSEEISEKWRIGNDKNTRRVMEKLNSESNRDKEQDCINEFLSNEKDCIHEHLELTKPKLHRSLTCTICHQKLTQDPWIYSCKSCYYYNIHTPCLQIPTIINHPSHPKHSLSILFYPTYLSDFPDPIDLLFNCEACGLQHQTGISYHCTPCKLNIHIDCASKPLSINHQSHSDHPLHLVFSPPYQNKLKGFRCDVCGKLGLNQWVYRCDSCGFDAHISCATPENSIGISHESIKDDGTSDLSAQVRHSVMVIEELQNEVTDLKNKYEELQQQIVIIKGMDTNENDKENTSSPQVATLMSHLHEKDCKKKCKLMNGQNKAVADDTILEDGTDRNVVLHHMPSLETWP